MSRTAFPKNIKLRMENRRSLYPEPKLYDTIFTAILLNVMEYGRYEIIDIQLGNLRQGLILAAHHPEIGDSVYISDSADFDWVSSGDRDLAEGY